MVSELLNEEEERRLRSAATGEVASSGKGRRGLPPGGTRLRADATAGQALGSATGETPAATVAARANRHLVTEEDVGLFQGGTHLGLYEKLGAHPVTMGRVAGAQFAVWAPNAEQVSVMGDFNHWDRTSHP